MWTVKVIDKQGKLHQLRAEELSSIKWVSKIKGSSVKSVTWMRIKE